MQFDNLTQLTYYRGRVAQAALLRGLGVGSGDQVAIQAFTCLAVPEGVLAMGAKPLYVDIESDGFNMSAESLASRLTPSTRAIIVQHTFGIPAEMNAIMRIADERGIPVIEDCCHTFLSRYQGQAVGTFGVGAFYSFEWGKPVVAGIGGAALANDMELARQLTNSRNEYTPPSALKRLKIELQYQMFGLLYWPRLFWPVRTAFHTLSRLGAAEGNFNELDTNAEPAADFSMCMAPHLVKRLRQRLGQIERIGAHSRKITSLYRELISSERVIHPNRSPGQECVFARYPLRVQDKQEVLAKAKKANIELAEWYSTPIHPIASDRGESIGYEAMSCPRAEERSREIVSLPTHGRVGKGYPAKAAEFFDLL